MRSLYPLLGVTSPFDPAHRYTTSYFLPPYLLAAVRLLISIYAFIIIITTLSYHPATTSHSFSYFTILTLWGLAFYFLISGLHTLVYARTGSTWLQHWPRPLQAAHSVYYTTIVTFPFLVTVVFWAVLFRGVWFGDVFDGWANVSEHALNSCFAILEIVTTRTDPPPALHLVALVLILALYLSLAYITYATIDFYPYVFLDPSIGSGLVAGYCFAILAAICVIFGVVWVLIWVRKQLTEKVMKMEGKYCRARKRSDTEMGSG